MRTVKIYLALLLSCSLCLISCVKDGEVGPPGEKGVQGPQGPQGDKGPKGEDADTKQVELYASDWFDSAFTGSGTNWSFTIPASQITQEVLDKYIVHVYFLNLSGNFLYKLPYKGTYDSPNKVIANTKVGEIEIQSTYNVGSRYRFVIIDPTK